MYKGSTFQQTSAIGHQNQTPSPPTPINGRNNRQTDNRQPRMADRDMEELAPRPIIKEEDLNRMDEISRDVGWAESDDIDYK